MSTEAPRASAQIYIFPQGGRAGLERRRNEDQPDDLVADRSHVAVTACGCWYHEEALHENEDQDDQLR